MTDTFHSADITRNGISVKIIRDGIGHRVAIGMAGFESQEEYQEAVAALLEQHLGKNLAVIAAAISAREDDKAQALAYQAAAHAAEVAALEADLATLGTKEEAQAMRAAQEAAKLDADIAALQAKRATLTQAADGIFKVAG